MARLARVTIPGVPHHVIQRGNRRQKVFFRDEDKAEYLRILKEQAQRFKFSIWAYCLMDNHVHLVVVPKAVKSLARGIGETHRVYTCMIHSRERWKGYLWQGRFLSYPMDEQYLYCAIRYIERNPVRAKIVEKAADYPWSSARDHINRTQSELLDNFSLLEAIKDWEAYLEGQDEDQDIRRIELHSRTGRPAGNGDFLKKLEEITGRILAKRKPGPR